MALRKNQATLSAAEKTRFVQAVLALKAERRGDTNTYDQYVKMHDDFKDAGHYGPAFFPWHREFLRRFERDLQRITGDNNLGLPYWDWSVDNSKTSSIWGSDFMGGNGSDSADWQVMDGPFAYSARPDGDPRKWTLNVRTGEERFPYLRRQFGFDARAPSLPTPADVQAALRATPYDVAPWDDTSQSGFRNRAEGWIPAPGPWMHNRVHAWVGGSMAPMTSPNDPVFFLHHCFLDKLWADWQVWQPQQGGEHYSPYLPTTSGAARPGHNLDDAMPPWNLPNDTVSPAHVLYTHVSLGYRYDTDVDLQPFEVLIPDQQINSWDGNYGLIYQTDGNLVLYRLNPSRQAIWNSGTAGTGLGLCFMLGTGELAIYGPSPDHQRLWASGTSGNEGSRLVVQNNGKVAIYRPDGRAVWTRPPPATG